MPAFHSKNQAPLLLTNHHHLGRIHSRLFFLQISNLWIQQNQMIVQFHLFLVSIMITCIDPYTVNLVLGGMIVIMSFEFATRSGLGQISLKKENKKSSIPRKRSPWAAGVNSLESDQASDPIIFDLILRNFKQVCIFWPNKPITRKCRLYTDQYNEDLWLSSLRIFGWTTFTPRIMKEYLHAANTLRAYFQCFEVADYLVRLFPLSVLESLGNGELQDIRQEVLHAINKMRYSA